MMMMMMMMTDWGMLKGVNLLNYYVTKEEYFSGLSLNCIWMFKVEEEMLVCSLLRCHALDIGSFLNNRNREVQISGVYSNLHSVSTDVPQIRMNGPFCSSVHSFLAFE